MLGESSIPPNSTADPITNLQNYKIIKENIRDIRKNEKTKKIHKKKTHRSKSCLETFQAKGLNKKAVDEDPLHQVAPSLLDLKNLIET